MVNCLFSMAQNVPSSTIIEAECNDPSVFPFNHCEQSTGEVVVLRLLPTVWDELGEEGTA